VWGGRPRPPLLTLFSLRSQLVYLNAQRQDQKAKSKAKAAGEGARPTPSILP